MPAPPAAEPGRRSAAVPEAAEESPNFFDERFDFEEPFDLLESAEAPAVSPEAPEPAAAESSERPPRKRRRRRRRGRDSEQRDSRAEVLPEASGDRSSEVAPTAAEDLDRISVEAEAEAVDVERPSDETPAEAEERRSRRRRPRRGKKRPRGAEPSRDAADRSPVAEPAPESPEPYDMEEIDRGVHEDHEIESGEGDEVEGDHAARLGFRGIPTWDEVIGLIVDKNLEARTKRAASHPVRGHRGPRDNRGSGGNRRPS